MELEFRHEKDTNTILLDYRVISSIEFYGIKENITRQSGIFKTIDELFLEIKTDIEDFNISFGIFQNITLAEYIKTNIENLLKITIFQKEGIYEEYYIYDHKSMSTLEDKKINIISKKANAVYFIKD